MNTTETILYEKYISNAIDKLIDYNKQHNPNFNIKIEEDVIASGKLTGGIFSNLNGVVEYVHMLGKINNLYGSVYKAGLTIRYSYKGKQTDINNFNIGIKSI